MKTWTDLAATLSTHPVNDNPRSKTMSLSSYLSSAQLRFAALLVLPLLLASGVIVAAEAEDNGVLDITTEMPTTGSGATQTIQSGKPGMAQMHSALKKEREELKKINRKDLAEKASKGERAAQLVLAEEFADEANHGSITIVSANDALSDAAYWYSLAARRGYPGAPAVDGALPAFPLRSIRGPE